MKAVRILSLAAAGLIASGVLITTQLASAATNLVSNPGFESGLAGWSCSGGSTVGSPVHSGSAALSAAVSNSDTAQCTQNVSVVSGSQYTLTAWVQGNYVYLGVTGGASTWTPGTGGWAQLTVNFTASSSSAQIYLHGWYAQGTYFADDVTLTGPGGPPPPPPSVPPTPTGLKVTGVTGTSVSLSWNASAGATGYKVYRGSGVTAVAGTSATVSGLSPATSYSFAVTATNAAGESPKSAAVSATTLAVDPPPPPPPGSPRSWPYIDITMATPTLADAARATGQKFFTLAFVLGSAAGCVPAWGGTIDLNDARITKEIADLRALGGDVAVSFGGAAGPYLQQTCSTQAQQVGAIEKVMDTFNVRHIDFDIEASVPFDPMNKAIAQVQRERSGTVVSYTLMVQGDDFGLTPSLGVDLLKNAKANGVNVGIVNPMTMDFGSSREWGDAVIAASQATLNQMAQIWPEFSSATVHRMLGVTPMIGRNDTGPIFNQADAQKLITWANSNHIGLVAFWSVGRDNGGCPGGGVSPTCSSISQSQYEFTRIFGGFTG